MPGTKAQFIVLAAGTGMRMGALGSEVPKWLLQIGAERIAERQLAAIEVAVSQVPACEASIKVVTGHGAPAVAEFLAGCSETIDAIFNPDYARWNNWYSVLCGLRSLNATAPRVVIINSDLVASNSWISQFFIECLSTPAQALIAVDEQRQLTPESMKVAIRRNGDGRGVLTAIGKQGIPRGDGEYIGTLMVQGEALKQFQAVLEAFEGDDRASQEWYEAAVMQTIENGIEWSVWPTPDQEWIEIDDPDDYRRATEVQ
jgi:choline kinase